MQYFDIKYLFLFVFENDLTFILWISDLRN